MNRISLLIFLLLSLVGHAFSQDSPILGNIGDVTGMHNCYIVADSTQAHVRIVKELEKKYPQLQIVESIGEAQFFLEYKVLRIESDNDPTAPVTYSEMIAYTMKDNRRVIAWSDKEDNEGISRKNEINLVRNFIKALDKAGVIRTRD